MDNNNSEFKSNDHKFQQQKSICIELNDDINGVVFNGGRRRSNAFSFSSDTRSVAENDECIDDTKYESLVSNTVQVIKHRDFVDEFRPKRDIDLFKADPHVILDCQEYNLEAIIHKMISHLSDNESNEGLYEAKKTLFADGNQLLRNTIQGMYGLSSDEHFQYDQSWLCTFCSLPSLSKRKVCIARLRHPTNLGITSHDVIFFILILVPIYEKATKSAEEASRTFGTIFADINFRQKLINATNEQQFIDLIAKRAHNLSENAFSKYNFLQKIAEKETRSRLSFGKGIIENVSRRLKYYYSDYVDGFVGPKTLHKTISTTISLYFACLLPCIAFGVLDDKNTNHMIDTRRALIGQTIGGAVFALIGGQPLVIIMTTAPLCLYIKVVYDISLDLEVNFYDMFACVGLWNTLFVLLYAVFDVSVLMRWCSRSTEEIFSLFIFFAFSVDAIKECVKNFQTYYCVNECLNNNTKSMDITSDCLQQNSILFLFLMLATVWLAQTIYNFNKTPYLSGNKRELLADYALPLSVIAFSFVGTFLFRDIKAEPFKISDSFEFKSASFTTLTAESVFVAMVNNPNNNLKKGSAYDWDLLVVAILNGFLSIFGMPWMHGILPHSPLHARSLADVEQRVTDGYVHDIIIKVRETRVTGLAIHILIGLSLFLIPHPLDYIPVSVLSGLFLYCAFASLRGNSFFERILLFLTEQTAYPPNHYVRRCPQRKIHIFTFVQLIQLVILCFFGFAPWAYVQMAFPIIIAILIPIRFLLMPMFLEKQYMDAIDGYH
ncbi:solute carrier family 4 member 11-like isoform X2 [Oppia nitens]|uniref:solute carrier family 4 member 11-like isoform X2 n=1 Tax=Oppia nitens TaxID=1686743 RepID=UPI0023DADD4B|nr:solute carrier family 4 member 11-like isoform X2 [Oppia nitens]